ncbi:MAG: CRISPR-associated endonuclease Cas2 [Desulfovibrionaceae bacterium]|nr:CRISPR-associated endonuclease Cas2 [Desulfovibrionaceae bacterium]
MRDAYLIVYDIGHPARLRAVAKIVQDYGLRQQDSVFVARMTADECRDMERRLSKVIEPEEDGIKIFRLCRDCGARFMAAGKTEKPKLFDAEWQIC